MPSSISERRVRKMISWAMSVGRVLGVGFLVACDIVWGWCWCWFCGEYGVRCGVVAEVNGEKMKVVNRFEDL